MTRTGLLLCLCSLVSAPAIAAGQQPTPRTEDERAVLAVVNRLFDGMRARDTTMVRSIFHAEARLVSTELRNGEPVVQIVPADRFVQSIGRSTRHLDEQIHDTEVRVDDNLGTVWTGYHFYLDGNFSHCGVDAFQLARTGTEWKIVAIADTRRTQGCEPERWRR